MDNPAQRGGSSATRCAGVAEQCCLTHFLSGLAGLFVHRGDVDRDGTDFNVVFVSEGFKGHVRCQDFAAHRLELPRGLLHIQEGLASFLEALQAGVFAVVAGFKVLDSLMSVFV